MATQRPPRRQPDKPPQGSGQQPQPPRMMPRWLTWILLGGVVIWNILLFWPSSPTDTTNISYSTFRAQVAAGNVKQVSIAGPAIRGTFITPIAGVVLSGTPTATAGTPQATPAATTAASAATYANFQTTFPRTVGDQSLMPLLQAQNVRVDVSEPSTPWFLTLLSSVLPFVLLIGLRPFRGRQAAGAQGGIFSLGRSQARRYAPDRPPTTFAD